MIISIMTHVMYITMMVTMKNIYNLFTFLQTACYPPLDLFCQLFRCSPETQILNTVFQKDNVSLGKHQLIFDLI